MIQTKNLMTNCLKFWKNKFFDLQMRTNDEIIPDINNLNDTRKPGQKNSWKPDMMPSGTNTYKMAAFNYHYMNTECSSCAIAEHSVIYLIDMYPSRQIYVKSRSNAPYRIAFSGLNYLGI